MSNDLGFCIRLRLSSIHDVGVLFVNEKNEKVPVMFDINTFSICELKKCRDKLQIMELLAIYTINTCKLKRQDGAIATSAIADSAYSTHLKA